MKNNVMQNLRKLFQKLKFRNSLMFFLLLAAQALMLSCAKKEAPQASGQPESRTENQAEADLYWRRVTEDGIEYLADKMGNQVPFKTYKRIIVISPGAVETLYLIGAEDAILAVSESREGIWPEEKTAALPTVGNTARPSLEQIISLEGDLILGNAMNQAIIADLTARGKPAIIHGADSMEDIFNSAVILGELTGRQGEAEALVAEKKELLASISLKLGKNRPALKGAFLYSVNPISAFTEDSLPGEIFTLLGAENIAAGLPAEQPILSPEYILAKNPDFLFGAMSITKTEDILNADSVILKTTAGIRGSITIVPSAYFLRPSPRIVDCIIELSEVLDTLGPNGGEGE
jgi:iron complex transport system substrate-binding protein